LERDADPEERGRHRVVGGLCAGGGFFANRVPSSFLPDEDQGYAFVNLQLPNGASLERTTAVAADVEKILMSTPGVQYSTTIIGFSLLSYVRTSYNAFFFVTFKPWMSALQEPSNFKLSRRT